MTCASHSCRDWKGNLRPQPIPQTHSCAPFKEKFMNSVFVFVCICICVYLYLCVFVYIPCWVGTILHPSLLPSSWQASVSEERSPTKSKPIATQPPAIVQKRVFHSEILALVFAFFMKYEWRRFYYVWRREVWQKARPLKPNPCHGRKRGITLNYWITRSLGDLRAPTSSWGPFRPIDFLAQAV